MIRYREPALTVISLVPPAVATLVLFLVDLTPREQASINGLAVAVAGLATAAMVAREKLAPAIIGLAAALLEWLASVGFQLDETQSTGLMAFITLVVGAYVRTQVFAGAPPAASPVP